MKEEDYKHFLEHLYHEYVRRTIPEFLTHHQKEEDKGLRFYLENSLQPYSLIKVISIVNHIKNHCRETTQIHETFKENIILEIEDSIGIGIQVANKVAKSTDFLTIIDKYLFPLVDGLSLDYIPNLDLTLYHSLGINPDSTTHIIADMAEVRLNNKKILSSTRTTLPSIFPLSTPNPKDLPPTASDNLREISEKLKKTSESSKKNNSSAKQQKGFEINKRNIEWFRDLEYMGKGAAIMTANVSFAAGLLDCCIEPETEKYKSIASAVLGYGLIILGAQNAALAK